MKISHKKLVIKQVVEVLEVFVNFETKNKYQVLTERNEVFSYAFEDSSFVSRFFLKNMRPTKINLMDDKKNIYGVLEKSFAFFLPRMKISDGKGKVIANVKTKFGFFKKILEVDVLDGENFECMARALKPWTFNLNLKGKEFARITKKFSGGKEIFTDSDNFIVDFMNTTDENLKLIILALSFGIDLVYFER